ncbi:4Fe-4S dicluster domain-containing protein [Candidatus Woesearchaeota archaeon]|nr:4Fe-4S dicluster domain-containing protein [Candidatus Woesearchaeota archaeon]
MTQINFELRNELVKEIPELLKCFQCGTCVSSCLAERYGKAYSPRRKILMALYGQKDMLAKELWRCLTCNNCNERCPQEVNPYDVLVKLKNFAVKKGLVDETILQPEKTVTETGRSLPLNERVNNQRKELGLNELKEIDELKKLK